MDSFHKPNALSFDGNTSENWRRSKQQFDIYITASGSEKKDDAVKIAILQEKTPLRSSTYFSLPKVTRKSWTKFLSSLSSTVSPGRT